jgi:ubiquinone/menaquinone biosynthesis C-methylase UbiE
MKLSNAFSLLLDLRLAISVALFPTLKSILGRPSLLIHPQALSRIFFSHVWTGFSAGVDEAGSTSKSRLLTSSAITTGVVLDIGAGHGHVTAYLPRETVTCYVALEPNTDMHDEIRRVAAKAGYFEHDGSLKILGCGAGDVDTVVEALGGVEGQCVDTMTAILTLCTIPDGKKVIEELVRRVLKPGGVFLYYEHVRSDREDVAW